MVSMKEGSVLFNDTQHTLDTVIWCLGFNEVNNLLHPLPIQICVRSEQ